MPLSTALPIQRIGSVFADLPDTRGKSNNRRYAMEDAALAAFSIFFTQSPSFLDSQVRMQKQLGKNNALSLFGVHQIPSDNQIRNLLDPVPPDTLFASMATIGDELYRDGHLNGFRPTNDSSLIALDGTGFFSSEKISCPCCTQSEPKSGKTLNRHIAVTPVPVSPEQKSVVALAPRFVRPQDGHDKQGCGLAASGRWLDQWGSHYAAWGITYLGDDLYCHRSHCARVVGQRANFLFTCKPESHATLYEWVADFARSGGVRTVLTPRRIGKKSLADTCRTVDQVPLRDSDDALMVNWFELVTTNANGDILFRNARATSHRVTADNVAAFAAAGRARWKIENGNNNTLKTKGYHFEHNFGHGKKNLSNLFATMILLAFPLHTTLELTGPSYRAVRGSLPSRRTFFEHLRALIQYLPFDDRDHLMRFMLKRLNHDPPGSG